MSTLVYSYGEGGREGRGSRPVNSRGAGADWHLNQ